MTSPAPDETYPSVPLSRTGDQAESLIQWPEEYAPGKTHVFAHNEIVIPAPPERIWRWLLRAQLWPEWYSNAANIHFLSHTGPDLRNRSRFRWKTFGVKMTSKVLEFEPYQRIAWDAQGIGVHAYHGWVLTPVSEDVTHVVTEESRTGWLARLGQAVMPGRMHEKHQMWLESLSVKAQTGPPPENVPQEPL